MDIKGFFKFKYIRIVLYIGLILALVLLKFTNIIDSGCYIKESLGFLCPSCGITRATKAILNLDFTLAVKYNSYYTLVLLPIFLVLLVDDIFCILFKKRSFVDIIFGE